MGSLVKYGFALGAAAGALYLAARAVEYRAHQIAVERAARHAAEHAAEAEALRRESPR